ncbi:hypothetical protein M2T39_28720, partial [Klebsiella pneumoniae]|nr:hypothetical protein [Klebsiella pneumoniae]
GRAGRKGTAISLVEAHDHLLLLKIGRYIEEPLKARVIDELRPTTRAPSEKLTGKPSKKVLAKRAEKKKEKEKEKPRVKMIMQVHDELVFEVHKDDLETVSQKIHELM